MPFSSIGVYTTYSEICFGAQRGYPRRPSVPASVGWVVAVSRSDNGNRQEIGAWYLVFFLGETTRKKIGCILSGWRLSTLGRLVSPVAGHIGVYHACFSCFLVLSSNRTATAVGNGDDNPSLQHASESPGSSESTMISSANQTARVPAILQAILSSDLPIQIWSENRASTISQARLGCRRMPHSAPTQNRESACEGGSSGLSLAANSARERHSLQFNSIIARLAFLAFSSSIARQVVGEWFDWLRRTTMRSW